MDVAVIGWIRQGEMMQGHLCDESVKVSTLVHKVPFRDALMDCCTSKRDDASECVVEVRVSACVGREMGWGPVMLLWNHAGDWIMGLVQLGLVQIIILVNYSSSVKM